MFWVALAGVVAVFAYTVVSAWQAELSRRTLELALSQQRAWLRITLAHERRGLTIDESGLDTDLEVQATNVGTVPAYGVIAGLAIQGFPEKGLALKPEAMSCSSLDTRPTFGTTVFPGETVPVLGPPPSLTRKQVDEIGRGRTIGLFAVACIAYEYGAGDRVHHTQSTFRLARKHPTLANLFFNLTKDSVSNDELNVSRATAGDRAD